MSPYYDPFPSTGKFILRYSDTITLNPAMGATGHHLWRANSIYDPDYSSAGHQPYGRDILAQIYNHYVVDKSVCTLTPTKWDHASISGVGMYGISCTDDATTEQNYDAVRERKGTTWTTLPAYAGAKTLVRTYDRKKMWPVEKDTSADFGSSPSEEVMYDTWVQAYAASVDLASVSFVVNITFYVTCYELKDLGES